MCESFLLRSSEGTRSAGCVTFAAPLRPPFTTLSNVYTAQMDDGGQDREAEDVGGRGVSPREVEAE